MKTIVAISDLHCGHRCGLTPPDFQETDRTEAGKQQRLCWDFYSKRIPKGADAMFLIGDAIDGKGWRTGGTELLSLDRQEQAQMAADCVAEAKPKRVIMCYGTGYHTGTDEDWECIVADNIRKKKIHVDLVSHGTVIVEGITFDLKHKIGGSTIPHGRHTAASRERLWNIEWYLREQRPLADVILRAHVHYYQYCGAAHWLAITMPGLQGLGSKYGTRECAGTVDFGFLVFKTTGRGQAGQGSAGQGSAGQGEARQGEARQGKASTIIPRPPLDWWPVLMPLKNMATRPITI